MKNKGIFKKIFGIVFSIVILTLIFKGIIYVNNAFEEITSNSWVFSIILSILVILYLIIFGDLNEN